MDHPSVRVSGSRPGSSTADVGWLTAGGAAGWQAQSPHATAGWAHPHPPNLNCIVNVIRWAAESIDTPTPVASRTGPVRVLRRAYAYPSDAEIASVTATVTPVVNVCWVNTGNWTLNSVATSGIGLSL